MRPCLEREHPLDVLRPVDVEGEERIVDDGDLDAEALRPLDQDGSSSDHAERRLERVGRAKRKCVRAAVLRGCDRRRMGRLAEEVERLGPGERAVRHDDERAFSRAAGEGHRDSRRMSAAGVDENVHAGRSEARIGGDDEDVLDCSRLSARTDDVGEHRLDQACAQLGGIAGREPALPGSRRICRNDGEHGSEHTLAATLTVLCGGLGGSRLVDAVARAVGPESVTAVGNVGDDVEVLGLAVSPDLDTVLYTLAGLLDEGRGWGVREESYRALAQVGALGGATWFTLGDRDIGLHLVRTERLRRGERLSAVTAGLADALGVRVRLLPATDDRVRTVIATDDGELEFQEWFVARRHADAVRGVRFEGATEAAPSPGVLEALASADAVVIAPSNPFVSIRPILAVPGIEAAIRSRAAPVAAVSPVIGGRALRGPLVAMLDSLGCEPTAVGVARIYAGLVDVFVLDRVDRKLAGDVESLGMRPVVCETVMLDPDARWEVGRQVLEGILG
jgi:LPPG:FO 2-phospho-L-lactate transferase